MELSKAWNLKSTNNNAEIAWKIVRNTYVIISMGFASIEIFNCCSVDLG